MRRALLVVVTLILAPTGFVIAFDTGHHSDMTRRALSDLQFGDDAIRAVQVANWLTDYYSAPTSVVTKDEFEKLHFDCVFSTQDVGNYWKQYAANTYAATTAAAQSGDTLQFLMILGISLHTVQDFYTHSNWVARHPRNGGYRTETWWNSSLPPGTLIYTGWYPNKLYPTRPPQAEEDHGNYFQGLNKDSYVRPRWDEAYVFAYSASVEWASAVCAWAEAAKPGFIKTVRDYKASNAKALDYDTQAAYRISEWISAGTFDPTIDGHWKGNHSGRIASFTPFVVNWMAAPDSPYVQSLKQKKPQLLLTQGLYAKNPQFGNTPPIAATKLNKVAVSVRTLHLNYVGSGGLLFQPTYYAMLDLTPTSGSQSFVEAMQKRGLDKDYDVSWWTMHFVDQPQSKLAIRYSLYNEDASAWPLPGSDRAYKIKNTSNQDQVIQFTLDLATQNCQGDINGVHDKESNAVVLSGPNSGFSASVKLWARSDPLSP